MRVRRDIVDDMTPRPLLVLAGGLVAGTLDIAYACAFWSLTANVPPRRILQSVAAGLLGKDSFTGGASTAWLGLALHFLIAVTMSVVYFAAARRFHVLAERPMACGALYGVLLYGTMNYVVVPLSAAPGGGARNVTWIVLSIAVHMLFVGIPIALFTSRALHRTVLRETGPVLLHTA